MTDQTEIEFRKSARRKTILSFTIFIIAIFTGYGIYKWIVTSEKDDKTYLPFRKVLAFNSKVFATKYDNPALAKEYPKTAASKKIRANGDLGLKSSDTTNWILKVVRNSDSPVNSDTIRISLDELKAMPKTEVVFNFKCIEGWSQIGWWGGVKFSEVAKKYHFGTRDNSIPDAKANPDRLFNYCGLRTPDGEYYVGIDMPSMMHPQTILCYELNGQPLPMIEGAPLRLIIPVKYGIKHIKRIGTIFFSDTQPPDYWGLRGYDYYAGH